MIFDVDKKEAELILASLAKQPYEAVSGIIQKLLEQGNKQLASEEAPEGEADSAE